MQSWGPALLAGAIAAAIALLELISSRYRHTHIFIRAKPQLYVYAGVYGLVAFLLMSFVESLVSQGTIKIRGLGMDSPWGQAVAIGLTVKALMNITLFNVASGAGMTPIGISTLTHLFEPLLIGSLDGADWNGLRAYLRPYVARFPDVIIVRGIVEANIPPSVPSLRREALSSEIRKRTTVVEVMELYFREVGDSTFRTAFV